MLPLKYLSSSVQFLACVLLISTLASETVHCSEEKHVSISSSSSSNNNDSNNSGDSSKSSNHVSFVSTSAPALSKVANALSTHAPLAISVAPATIHHEKSSLKAGVSTVSTLAPLAAIHPSEASKEIAVAPGAPSTIKPLLDAKAPLLPAHNLSTDAHASAPVVAAKASTAAATGASQKLVSYFEPICTELDKLLPKQMFKIQAQMKQFIEKTAGKMSLCFMQNYALDPNLTPINKQQLGTICSSRTLASGTKGSFKDFQACAEQNWDKNLEIELERIIKLRLNCVKSHAHAKNDSSVSLLHDDDAEENQNEAAVISDVVGKVLDTNKVAVNKSDIKMIDVGGSGSKALPAAVPAQLPSKKILNDPNTVVVFVDEPLTTLKPTITAAAPASVAGATVKPLGALNSTAPTHKAASVIVPTSVKPTVAAAIVSHETSLAPAASLIHEQHTTLAPLATSRSEPLVTGAPPTAAAAVTTLKPEVGSKSSGTSKAILAVTTVAPTLAVKTMTVKPSAGASLGEKILQAVGTIESPTFHPSTTAQPAISKSGAATTLKATVAVTDAPKSLTTGKPAVSTAIPKTTAAPAAEVKAVSVSTTAPAAKVKSTGSEKPTASVMADVLKKQEKEKKDFDSKLKAEREKVMKQVQKSKDEYDAKNAIKALQMQRAQQTHATSDARMHQIEHQRQMAIDPIGHTIKHQQYEAKKAAATAAPSTTAAPSKKL